VLLIYTTSFDTTVDLLLHHLGEEGCFRLNFDLWRDYKLEIGAGHFRIDDPTGRSIDDQRTRKVYYRKPFTTRDIDAKIDVSDQDAYCEAELWYALRDLINLLWLTDKLVLVEPRADMRVGKFVQESIARRYFVVPEQKFTFGADIAVGGDGPVVVKSLTFESVSGKLSPRVIYATRVDKAALSPNFPWLAQEYVEADRDVTVAFVRDELFAFELDRTPFLSQTVDWRELPVESTAERWRPHTLPDAVKAGIFAFMGDLNLHFGRLDFLCNESRYMFLEVNPNGQWGWLDTEGKHGLLHKMIAEVSPATACHPIPCKPQVRL
jgi:hypothetical protein